MIYDYFLLTINLTLGLFGQLFLKKNVGLIDHTQGLLKYIQSFLHLKLIIAFSLILFSPVFYLLALSNLPLGNAYVFTSLNYPLIIIGAYLYLGEKISIGQIFGGILILIGLIAYNSI